MPFRRNPTSDATLEVAKMLRLQRRDELMRNLPVCDDPDRLSLLWAEAADHRDDDARTPGLLRRAYWRNPIVPLPTPVAMGMATKLPEDCSRAVIRSLPARYADTTVSDALRKLALFVGTQDLAGAPWGHELVDDWLADRLRSGDVVSEAAIRWFLTNGAASLAPTLLYLIDLVAGKVGPANRVNILAVVCQAAEDLALYDDIRLPFAQLLHRDGVRDLGSLGGIDGAGDNSLSLTPSHLAGLVVFTTGRMAGGDDHLTMRCMQALPAMLAGFDQRPFVGRSAELAREGLAELQRHRSNWNLIDPIAREVGRLAA